MTKKNNCHEGTLTLYHYDELTEDQRHELELHLQSCPACRTALAEIKSSLATVPSLALKLTSEQKQRFVEKVTKTVRRRTIRRFAPWGGLAAAGGVAVVVLLLLPVNQKGLITPAVPATADFEVFEKLELLQELDLLQELELLQALEKLG